MPDILILGATSDIAAACAKKYASKGFNVWLAGRNMEPLKKQATDLEIRYNIKAFALPFDGVDFSTHQPFTDGLTFVPDVVLLAYGYLGDQNIAEDDWEECNLIITSNYTGAVSILNKIAKLLERNGKGTIVGISSVAGIRGKKSNFIYGSAKAGFTVYLSGLRNKLFASKVHVVTVLPGPVYTKMTEHMKLSKALTANPATVADDIYNAAESRKNIIYSKGIWRYVMLIISNIPEFIFKKLNLG